MIKDRMKFNGRKESRPTKENARMEDVGDDKNVSDNQE